MFERECMCEPISGLLELAIDSGNGKSLKCIHLSLTI